MECIQRVDPKNWELVPTLVELYSNLPTTLRCSPVKNSTLFRKKSKTDKSGHTFPYIGYNPPNTTRYIVIDLDYDLSMFAYSDTGIPRPQIIIRNPLNGHCHYVYQLKDAITFYAKSSSDAIRYLTVIEQALTEALGGDKGFTGHLAKNALNSAHDVYITGTEPYTLKGLADFLDFEPIDYATIEMNDPNYGRNSGTFDAVRVQAYKIASALNYTQLYNECLSLAESHNEKYPDPMSYNEIKGIAKSIAGYCKSKRYQSALSGRQKIRGAKGGKVSKRPPVATSESSTKPWLELGISRRTYYSDKAKQAKRE